MIERRVEFEWTPFPGYAYSKISLHCLYLNFLGVPFNSRSPLGSKEEIRHATQSKVEAYDFPQRVGSI